MATASRDRSARARIREYLTQNGPVEDGSGRATVLLKDAVGYEGNDVAFIQLVTAMDKANELKREIRGKRTYKISAPVAASAPGAYRTLAAVATAGADSHLVIDYDELARALLRELARVLAPSETRAETSTGLDEVLIERDRLLAERDEYAQRLKTARRQLNALLAESIRGDDPDAELDSDAGRPGQVEQAS